MPPIRQKTKAGSRDARSIYGDAAEAHVHLTTKNPLIEEPDMSDLPMHYQTKYEWQGKGADGVLAVLGHADLPAGTPHDSDRYSPEHLLVAAAEICLANYVMLIAGLSKLEIKGYRSSAEGELEREPKAGYRFKRIVIRPELTVGSGTEAQAGRVLEKAHRSCLIARSLNCPVDIEPQVHI